MHRFKRPDRAPRFDRRAVLRGGFALACTLAIPAARACEFQVSTLTIVHPWVRATREGATAATVCMKFKDVFETDRLIGVRTPVATAFELGAGAGAIEIPAGRETLLTEAGAELRLLGLQVPLQMGRMFPLTLSFEKGGDVRTDLNVDFFFG
jgi:copper(I)-binding protein